MELEDKIDEVRSKCKKDIGKGKSNARCLSALVLW